MSGYDIFSYFIIALFIVSMIWSIRQTAREMKETLDLSAEVKKYHDGTPELFASLPDLDLYQVYRTLVNKQLEILDKEEIKFKFGKKYHKSRDRMIIEMEMKLCESEISNRWVQAINKAFS